MRLVVPTLKSIAIKRPQPVPGRRRQHFCGDKGYDSAEVRCFVQSLGYMLHIKSRGDEVSEQKRNPRFRARRWVVERSHSWFNRFRRILVRWEKKAANYEAMLHLACAVITLQQAGVLA